jgi:tetratricopeptide (TPR) repeat protein
MKNFKFVIFIAFLLLPFPLCWAGGKKDNDAQPKKQQTVSAISASSSLPTVYWTGDGGKGIKLAVLEPSGKGLLESEKWMLSMIQSSITGYFQRFSAMTIIDRQNLEKILGEQKQSMSGNYKDEDFISIGKLTNARYILAGSITKTANTYMLELAVTDAESGERKASYPPKAVSPFAIENLSAIKEATAELLKQLGVNLTEQGRKELNSEANTAQILAETALAKGIAAQNKGTVVEALSYYIQAANYDSGLVEAANRMNTLTANISSGNIGQDTRNDIAWRREWVKRLQETETFFANTIKEPQPYYIVYSTNIQKGKVDYQKETIELSVHVSFYPDFTWSDHINGVLAAVSNGLQATNRAQVWELDWPIKAVSTPSPFGNQTKNFTSTVIIEILNEDGKSIGRQTVKVPYGFKIKYTRVTPLWQWEGDVSFPAVDVNLITDKLTIRIASIDGIAAENAARQKKISIMPESEWNGLLQRNSVVKRNIDGARARQRGDELKYDNIPYILFVDVQRAFTAYTEAIRINPNDVDALVGRGWTYFDNNNNIMNFNMDFNAALKINPNDTDALLGRGHGNEDYDKSIADYTQAIRLDPSNSYLYYRRGCVYRTKADYDRAIADFTQALRIDPIAASAFVYVCLYFILDSYEEKNNNSTFNDNYDFDKDISNITQLIRLEPNNSIYYSLRGFLYSNNYDYDKAIADFTQALRIDPNIAYNFALRGSAYHGKGDYDKAITDYTQVIRLDPSNRNGFHNYINRGFTYYEKGDYDRAIADYTQALQFNPLDGFNIDAQRALSYNTRGSAYEKKGDKNRAIADFEIALKLYPDYTEARDNLRRVRGW